MNDTTGIATPLNSEENSAMVPTFFSLRYLDSNVVMVGAGEKEWSPQGYEKPAHIRHSAGHRLSLAPRLKLGSRLLQPERIGAEFRTSYKNCRAASLLALIATQPARRNPCGEIVLPGR